MPNTMSRSADLDRTVYYDRAVPAAWIRRLRREIIRCGNLPLHWMQFAEPPRNFFEQVVHRLREIVAPPASCVGAEYWGRAHAVETGFKFHFDRDEAQRDHIVSPALGSILYLSDVGGLTLVFDVGPTGVRLPTRGAGVVPLPGRLLTFPGQLLHGVQPGRPHRLPRVVLLVNWWAQRPSAPIEPGPAFCRDNPLLTRLPTQRRLRARKATSFAASDALDRARWKRVVEHARGWQ